MKVGLFAGALLAVLVFYLGKEMQRRKPRGIRNNNPGNITINFSNRWKGSIPRSQNTDGRFVQFMTMEAGVRAMTIVIINYYKRGLTTIREIISTYAPSFENKTDAYIDHVEDRIDIDENQHLDRDMFIEKMPLIVKAIIRHENGETIDPQEVSAGVFMGKKDKGFL